MSANGINHRNSRPMTTSASAVDAVHLPYVQRVDLHANRLAVVARAEHAGGPAQCRRQCQPAVARHPDQHPAHAASGRDTRRPAGARRQVHGPEQLGAVGQRRRRRAARSTASGAPSSAAMCTAGGSPTSARASSSASAWPTGSHRISACTVGIADSATTATMPPSARLRTSAAAAIQRRSVSSAARRSCRPSSAQLSSSSAAP